MADWSADLYKDRCKEGGWYEEQRRNVYEFYYAVPPEQINRLSDRVASEAELIEVSWFHGTSARFRA